MAISQQELSVTVSDPVQQGEGVQAYISYRVSTKVRMAPDSSLGSRSAEAWSADRAVANAASLRACSAAAVSVDGDCLYS